MCGIVGAIRQTSNAVEFLVEGLKRLEYRGYDSSGIAVDTPNGIERVRRVGRVALMEEAANEAEERRLFYVAVTRAKDYLWLCAPRMRKARDGGVMMCMPSRFLDEIDPDLLQIDKAGGFAPPPRWNRW